MQKRGGAKVPFMRSAENANDTATTVQALLEVVQEYEKQGKTFETLLLHLPHSTICYSTAPAAGMCAYDGIGRFSHAGNCIRIPRSAQ